MRDSAASYVFAILDVTNSLARKSSHVAEPALFYAWLVGDRAFVADRLRIRIRFRHMHVPPHAARRQRRRRDVAVARQTHPI